MYAAIAGLKTHMQNLNVIGNNIANINTQGYKSSRAVFQTTLYQSVSGGSNGTQTVAGRNPSQIGYGATVGSIDMDMSTGNYGVTGKPTDLMLDGDGFFLVGDKEKANNFDGTATDVGKLTSLNLTRVGNFEFKSDGYFANQQGDAVYGFLTIGIYGDGTNGTTAIPKPNPNGIKAGDPVFSDQLVPIRLPCVRVTPADPNATPPTPKKVEIAYPTATAGGHLTDATVGGTGTDANDPLSRGKFVGIKVDQLTGIITGTSADTEEVVVIGCVAVGLVDNPNGVTQVSGSYYKADEGAGELCVAVLGGGAQAMGIEYVNKSLAQGAGGANPPAGGTANADVDGLRIRSGGSTEMLSSGLEMSKTDLAQEIANMITTQRGYQANTRIITVTDSMLEELVNMKR
ncbi:MAG: flagellar hook-basal body complex protein [Lawsonibacter sp.]|nr:flagellar hook-basal body complex protein [Lawsonibacter sp.]